MALISESKLDFWIARNYNVLFRGKHGVGKTATILEAFRRHGLNFKYFSAATMDPWVDFIGVPKEKTTANNISYLDLVRPKDFEFDEIDVIFMDEFNRASAKVRNAAMELIQFKSINGKKYNRLKMIWAAINPPDDENDDEKMQYDVENLDPAQQDRFHIIIDVPFKPDAQYFREKYDKNGAVAVSWWNKLSKECKDLVSPRRLDYALDVFVNGGDMRDVLHEKINISELLNQLKHGTYDERIKNLMNNPVHDDIIKAFSDNNFLNAVIKKITSDKQYTKIFAKFLPEEKLCQFCSSDTQFVSLLTQTNSYDDFHEMLKPFHKLMKLDAKTAKATIQRLPKSSTIAHKNLEKNLELLKKWSHTSAAAPVASVLSTQNSNFFNLLHNYASKQNTYYNKKIFEEMASQSYDTFSVDDMRDSLDVYISTLSRTQTQTIFVWQQEINLTAKLLNDRFEQLNSQFKMEIFDSFTRMGVSNNQKSKIAQTIDEALK